MPRSEVNRIRHWSTSDVPAAERLDYFAAALSEAIVPFGVGEGDAENFRAALRFAQLDAIGITSTMGWPHTSFRRRHELARTAEHHFNLLMVLDAPWTADHRGRMRLSPRDILVHDSEFPLEIDMRHTFNSVNVCVSETWLRCWVPNPTVLTSRPVAGGSPWVAALACCLAALSPELIATPPLPLSVMADQVGGLLALTANSLVESSTPVCTRATRSLYARILDCITERCTEPNLTAGEVAASVNTSVRTLHRTMGGARETFGSKLIEARAQVAQHMLVAPQFKRLTTAEIGRRAGFSSSSHFARVLRKYTGRSLRELRRAASE